LFVDDLYCGFKETVCRKKRKKVLGIPIRDDFTIVDKKTAKKELGLIEDELVICALGGSQGSNFINQVFLKLVLSLEGEFGVIHLTGAKEYREILKFYQEIKRPALVKDFWDKMNLVYSAADILICRAGAMTLGEVSYFKVPAIVIPHGGELSHQYFNARYFQERGAVALIPQNCFSFVDFKNAVEEFLSDGTKRKNISDKLSAISLVARGDKFYEGIFPK